MPVTKRCSDKKYKNLWEDMEDDFEDLDADTYEEFLENVQEWAAEHYSVAIEIVAEAIYEQLHQEFTITAILQPFTIDLSPWRFGATYIRNRQPQTKTRYRTYYRKIRRLRKLGKTIRFCRGEDTIAIWKKGVLTPYKPKKPKPRRLAQKIQTVKWGLP